MTNLFRLAIFAAAASYALIVLSGVSRISDGRLDAPWVIESLHRLVAVGAAGLVLTVAIGAIIFTGTRRRTRISAGSALGFVIVQIGLGAVAESRGFPAGVATAALGTALLAAAAAMLTAYFVAMDRGEPGWLTRAGALRPSGPDHRDRGFLVIAQIAAAVTLILILSGAATSAAGATLACTAWPLCQDGRVVPDGADSGIVLNLSHRAVALLGMVTIGIVTFASVRRGASPLARRLAVSACVVIAAESLIGALYVTADVDSPWLSGVHLALAAFLWAMTVAIAIAARRAWEPETGRREVGNAGRTPASRDRLGGLLRAVHRPAVRLSQFAAVGVRGEGAERFGDEIGGGGSAVMAAFPPMPYPGIFVVTADDFRRLRAVVPGYVALTKPNILSLLLFTTVAAMPVAANGVPDLWLVLATLLGGTLAAGGANALNCYIDRDIDAIMPRTQHRGTASGAISPENALLFGLTLTTLAVVELAWLVNPLAAGLSLAGNLFYVLIYTKWLKRTTPQNIVIGGAAGAVPPLVGWAAVTNDLSPMAWMLFLIIFCWTPPHFWALALLKQGEYGRVHVPMLPVVKGEAETRKQILIYSVILAAVCLTLVSMGLSWVYGVTAVVLNALFLGTAIRLYRSPSKKLARSLFFQSLWYLAALFTAMVADRLLLG